MSYDSIQQSEYLAGDRWLFAFSGPDFQYLWADAPVSVEALINSVSTTFRHVRGGINIPSRPTESQDAGRTGLELRVAPDNPLVRRHREFPPHGDTELTIYHQNESGGVGTQVWSGIVAEFGVEYAENADGEVEEYAAVRCKHLYELLSGSEGLTETYGPTCPWVPGQGGCPVSLANITQTAEVTAVDPDTLTVEVTLDVGRDAGWFRIGVLKAPNGDMRTILEDEEVGTDKEFVLLQNFPSTTVKVGDTVSVIWGDDLTHGTCAGKMGAWTGAGAAFGGNTLQKNTNPHVIGRLQ